ncbi:hypothetical protein SLA2020_297970 [Shorea laevis]
MTSVASSCLLLLSSLAFLSIARGQDRAPHGIAYENPMAISPSAYNFFHPKTQDPRGDDHPCAGAASSSCSSLLLAAEVGANEAVESKVVARQHAGSNRVGAGGIAAIVFGCTLVVLLAMGVFYVLITRRANLNCPKTKPVQPEA